MTRYHGLLVDEAGYLHFSFTTPLCSTREQAEDFAQTLCDAWEKHTGEFSRWILRGEEG